MMVSVGQAVVVPFQQLQLASGQAPDFSETHGWGSTLAFVVALTLWTGVGIDLTQKLFDRKLKQGRSDVESVKYN
jgi:ACS family pantothenate transporter-like MFS transporter